MGFSQVFLLHAVAYPAMFAIRLCGAIPDKTGQITRCRMFFCQLTGLREQKLVHDDVVRVDFVRRQFLHQPLRLVQREELGYTHADERRLFLYMSIARFVSNEKKKKNETKRKKKGEGEG